MDRKEWARLFEDAIDRYRLHIAGEPAFDGDEGAWTPAQQAEATMEDHVVAIVQSIANLGSERLP